jgi:Right handed beta helix region/Protein of unknown function (DUF1565)
MPRGTFANARCGLLLSSVLAAAGVQASDYYVSTNGSDADPGTAAQPFRTITHAYTHVAPGVTIHVLPGLYEDYTPHWGLHLSKSGKANQPIVLQSTVQGGAVIDGQNAANRNEGIYLDGSYNVVDGFEIRNSPNGGIAIYGDGNSILNNEIHHNGNPPSTSGNGKDGVYSDEHTADNLYEANSIHDNGRKGSNLDHGLYLCGKNESVLRNLLFRNPACGLQIAGYDTVRNMKVYNNVIAWNGASGITVWQSLDGIDIKNNILYHNGHWGVGSWDAHGKGVVLDHNLCFGNASGNYDFTAGNTDCSHTIGTTISADPCFVNGTCEGFNAHLAPGSPALGAGLTTYGDFATLTNALIAKAAAPCDLGAYSLEGASTNATEAARAEHAWRLERFRHPRKP